MTGRVKYNYGTAIRAAFEYLLENHPEVFVIGQGLWSPWYVGNTMTDLDKKFGKERIIDTPVSEAGTTGVAIGASIFGSRPIVVHPRIDFMLYALDPIVNQAAKWSHMFGSQTHPSVTIRAIINRGGEQGAQHSQSLHAWLAHTPGLRVLMPYSVADARDMLVASVLCDDPVIYIDDRWLYEDEDILEPIKEYKIDEFTPKVLKHGEDITIVSSSYSTKLAMDASNELDKEGLGAEVIDLRTLNPFNPEKIIDSVSKTRNLLVLDGGTRNASFACEVITSVMEIIDFTTMKNNPKRITLCDAPAPTSKSLEEVYYPNVNEIIEQVKSMTSDN